MAAIATPHMAWLGDLSADTSPASAAADQQPGVDAMPDTSSILSQLWDAITYPFTWISNLIGSAENTVLIALVVLAVMIVAVIALIGFAPNVKHIIPHIAFA